MAEETLQLSLAVRGAQTTVRALSQVTQATQQLAQTTQRAATAGVGKLSQAMQAGVPVLRAFQNILQRTGFLVAGALGVAGIGGLIAGLVALARSVFQAAFNLAVLNRQFTYSAAVAGTTADELRRTVLQLQKLGVAREQAARAISQFTAVGATVEQASVIFSGLVAAQKAAGASSEELDRALIALTQILSKGTLSAEEMLQIFESGLTPLIRVFARDLGITTANAQNVTKALDSIGWSLEDLIQLTARLTIRDTMEAVANAAGSLEGAMTLARNAWERFLQVVGAPVLIAATEIMWGVVGVVEALAAKMEDNAGSVSSWAGIITSAVGGLIAKFGGFLEVGANVASMLLAMMGAVAAAIRPVLVLLGTVEQRMQGTTRFLATLLPFYSALGAINRGLGESALGAQEALASLDAAVTTIPELQSALTSGANSARQALDELTRGMTTASDEGSRRARQAREEVVKFLQAQLGTANLDEQAARARAAIESQAASAAKKQKKAQEDQQKAVEDLNRAEEQRLHTVLQTLDALQRQQGLQLFNLGGVDIGAALAAARRNEVEFVRSGGVLAGRVAGTTEAAPALDRFESSLTAAFGGLMDEVVARVERAATQAKTAPRRWTN